MLVHRTLIPVLAVAAPLTAQPQAPQESAAQEAAAPAPVLAAPVQLRCVTAHENYFQEGVRFVFADYDRDGTTELLSVQRGGNVLHLEPSPEGPDTEWVLGDYIHNANGESSTFGYDCDDRSSLAYTDFNQDGWADLLATSWGGELMVLTGTEGGFGRTLRLVDENRAPVQLPWGPSGSPVGQSVFALDADGDGDLDVLHAAEGGQVFLQRNGGDSNKVNILAGQQPIRFADGSPLVVEGGLTSACAADWDGDGRDDLIFGSEVSGVTWCRNLGGTPTVTFGPSQVLVPRPERDTHDGAQGPLSSLYVETVDYDGDGDLDLVLGGYYDREPIDMGLSAEQQAELKALDERFAELEAKRDALGEITVWNETAFYEIGDEMWPILDRIQELRPSQPPIGGIWLFRRN